MRLSRLFLCLALAFSLFCAPAAEAKHTTKPKAKPKAAATAPSYTYASAFAAMDKGQTGTVQTVLARGSDPALNKVLRAWLMAQPGNAYSFDDLASFVTENPDWPNLKGILMIAEQKLPSGAANDQIVNWFNAYPPLTPTGFSRHMEALEAIGHGRIAENLVRNRWIERDMGADERATFLSRYGHLLRLEDHYARLDRLLWKNDPAGAKSLYPYVDDSVQALAEARLALAAQSNNAPSLLARVPSTWQRDPGLLYEQLRWHRKNGNTDAAIEILLNAPEALVHAEDWWLERHIVIRRLMEQKDFALAYRLAAKNALSTGFEFVQAEFLAGWLALRSLNRPSLAESHFEKILSEASSPISRARGYYWLGRAHEASGRQNEATQAYQSASVLNTTFYGQLAATRLEAEPTIHAAPEPPVPAQIRHKFFARDSVKATEKLYRMGQLERARIFFKALCDYASQRVDFALLLELAYELQRPDWAINAAKAANQKNFIVTGAAYPVLSMHIPTPPEKALTHALIRQESLFKADAGSSAGAQGLMQLMPGTAKDVAKKLGIAYAPEKLTNPDYNVKLGTYFIQKQIDNFDGSYVLALAGYNAGPRRVREWIELFGDPRTREIDPVDWLELIPIYETRNYVQRIIENLQFYRSRLSGSKVPLTIWQDLKR